MDPISIGVLAGSVVSLLKGFFGKVGESVGAAAADGAGKTVGDLVGRLRAKLSASGAATSALDQLEKDPSNTPAAESLEQELIRQFTADEEFATEMAGDLRQISETHADVAFVNNIGTVGKMVQVNELHGDVNL